MFDEVINLIVEYGTKFGAIVIVFGAVVLGLGIKDHAGPKIEAGIGGIVGGAIVIGAIALLKQQGLL